MSGVEPPFPEPHPGEPTGSEVAVIGMAGRFPGAADVDAFWRNLREGVESIRFLSREESLARGLPAETVDDPSFVRAEAMPEGFALFDAPFFHMGHREAEITDPQHRLLLECAWHAFENAGYDPFRYCGQVGVYAGATLNTYLLLNLLPQRGLIESLAPVQLNIGNAGDFLATRISYKLDLKGPSHAVQSACSTSLVAVHLACQSLLEEESDLALAGGVSINPTLLGGYRFLEGGMASPDGHCRAFSDGAQGTIFGGGVGLVLLKRLEDALADGDRIRAVILGSAVNNDGSAKGGYTAPAVEGQARVIAEALANAGICAETVGYVEAHGTATPLGDPIEVEALTRAFSASTERKAFCSLGSLKSNIGHLDAAAGITGLIKTVLMLEAGEIPPSLHFERPSPQIDWAGTPFEVARELKVWPRKSTPRRAGVSAFGVGGTNVHAVLEEPPLRRPGSPSRGRQLLLLSARGAGPLEASGVALAEHLESAGEDLDLADVAYTLQVGRHALEQRRAVVVRDRADAVAALADPERVMEGRAPKRDASVAFLFPGQGVQYPAMTRDLYESEGGYRQEVDRCAEYLVGELGFDLRDLLMVQGDDREAAQRLERTGITQPALFTVEYSLARLWMSWGVQPAAMVGHSLGEYVAACLAGVFSLEDALGLVAARGRMMEALPRGSMLSVPMAEGELGPWLARAEAQGVAVAAVNGPERVTVSGATEVIRPLAELLEQEGVSTTLLKTSHAFHSPMMEPILEPFREQLARRSFSAPKIPFLSNLTGTWIRPEEATDPGYWVEHLRRPVRFADDLTELLEDESRLLLEVGPGQTLGRLARRHGSCGAKRSIVPSVPGAKEKADGRETLLGALGRLWLRGIEIDWRGFYGEERRLRVPLPLYPFERLRYWVEPPAAAEGASETSAALASRPVPVPDLEESAVSAAPAAKGRAGAHPRPELEAVYVAPSGELEVLIARVWEESLGVETIGAVDKFFDLGGDSVIAAQTIDRLKRELGRDVPVAALYEGVTVRALARVLSEEYGASQDGASQDGASSASDETRRSRMAVRQRQQQKQRSRRQGRRGG